MSEPERRERAYLVSDNDKDNVGCGGIMSGLLLLAMGIFIIFNLDRRDKEIEQRLERIENVVGIE